MAHFSDLSIEELQAKISQLQAGLAQTHMFIEAVKKRIFVEQRALATNPSRREQILAALAAAEAQLVRGNNQLIELTADIADARVTLREALAVQSIPVDNDQTIVPPNLDAVVNEQEANLISETLEVTSVEQIDIILTEQREEFERTGTIGAPQQQGGAGGLILLVALAAFAG